MYGQGNNFLSKKARNIGIQNENLDKQISIFVTDSIDYGNVSVGQTVEGKILLKNDSSQTYEITKVQTTCSCSIAFLDGLNVRVPPDSICSIPFSIDTSGKLGRVSNTFTLSYKYDNDPEILQNSFRVHIDVWKKGEIRVHPPSLVLENCVQEEQIRKVFDISFIPSDDMTLPQIDDIICPIWLTVENTNFQKNSNGVFVAHLTISGILPPFFGEIMETVKLNVRGESTQVEILLFLRSWSPIKQTPPKILKIVKKDDFPFTFIIEMEFQEQCNIFPESSEFVGLDQLYTSSRFEKTDNGSRLVLEFDRKLETTKRAYKGYHQFNVSIDEKVYLVSLPIFLILVD
jgi:hypothetical protein